MTWPLQSEMRAFYGKPGANLVRLTPPFAMTYDGKPLKSFGVNSKCKASLARVLATIWESAGHNQARIDEWGVSIFGGCFNDRSMIGKRTPSCHAFGAAIDLDPARNPYTHNAAARHFLSGCPVVEAFQREGWIWGGDWHGTFDAMHFQAARVR